MDYKQKEGKVLSQSSSNIAIVKYWGKRNIQIPLNPSVSFSLEKCFTSTSINYYSNKKPGDFSFSFLFDERPNSNFEIKLKQFFNRIIDIFPWLKHLHLDIKSSNTFPHSSGIASSASSYSALANALSDINLQITGQTLAPEIISEIARLGSGSACRSTQKGWNLWGRMNKYDSNDRYAVCINNIVHKAFCNIQDTILIVSNQQKEISSTVGHQLMNHHPYKNARIKQAQSNTLLLLDALKQGDWETFIDIAESEALSLHGLMMSSNPGYTLLFPESLQIITKIRAFRSSTKIPVGFTIDAGPNIHIIYPDTNKKEVLEFIETDLSNFCQDKQYIQDQISSF